VLLIVGCPDGWLYYEETDSCFYISTTTASFQVADSACESMNAYLPSISNQAEMDFLLSIS